MRARLCLERGEVAVDLARPVSLAIDLDFATQPRSFGAPPAIARPYVAPGFPGSVTEGGSCNCSVITLNPHCNGTHTESAGHLTREPLDAHRVVPAGLIPAVLVTIAPEDAGEAEATPDSACRPGDRLITQRALAGHWPDAPFAPRALIVRTLPNEPSKRWRDYSEHTPPYLSAQAARWLVGRGIEHLVVDLPSIDRQRDEGLLTAHRIFFGLAPGSRALASAARSGATVTELAYVPEGVADGPCMLEIQVPAIAGDAVPSRPLLYVLERA